MYDFRFQISDFDFFRLKQTLCRLLRQNSRLERNGQPAILARHEIAGAWPARAFLYPGSRTE